MDFITSNLNLENFILSYLQFLLPNQDEILHMPWQYCCHGMCNISSWHVKKKIEQEETKFQQYFNFTLQILVKQAQFIQLPGTNESWSCSPIIMFRSEILSNENLLITKSFR